MLYLRDDALPGVCWISDPETRYTRAGEVHIAYQVLGEGPVDVVLADMWFSNMDGQWDVPPLAEFRRRLASFSRLIMFDRCGWAFLIQWPSSRCRPSTPGWTICER